MRARARISTAAWLASVLLLPTLVAAQAAQPTSADIVNALTPRHALSNTTRGIRIGNQATASHAPSVSLTVLFATGSAELTPAARTQLDELGRALTTAQLAGYRFRIEGHTDTVGSDAMNQMLSARRADAVVGYLESRFNVAPRRLHPVGMGKRGLLVATPDQTPEPRNRRVLVVNTGS